jgi:serine phosphatase RsbU (regulator of sigma subunit)
MVRQIMVGQPIMVPPAQTVQQVVRLMNGQRIGAVLVADGDRLVGIFTERDVLRRAVEAQPGWRERSVAEWMTPNPHTIGPEATWEQARAQMEKLRVRHLPVVEGGRVVGMLTARDVMRFANEHLNRMVNERTRELREANERLQQRDAELRYHMSMAGKIQARLLPEQTPRLPEIESAALYLPLDPLGGDYYDFAMPTDRHLGILIADATGHSIPAAFVALMAHTAFATASHTSTSPARVLAGMNRQLHGLSGEHFVTAFYGIFDRATRSLTFANAGQPYPYWLRNDSPTAKPLLATGLMLGIMEDADYEEQSVQLQPGDRLLLYTDGLADCRNAKGEYFGAGGLVEFLSQAGDQSAQSITQRLAARLEEFRGDRPATDDITILAAVVS